MDIIHSPIQLADITWLSSRVVELTYLSCVDDSTNFPKKSPLLHAVTGLSSAALKGSHQPVKELLDVSDATIKGI